MRGTMGITKLADLIRSDAPDAISHKDISDYAGEVRQVCFNQRGDAFDLLEVGWL